MRLELREYQVSRMTAGPSTQYAAGVLTVDTTGLARLLERDERVESVQVVLVEPGADVRISNVLDVLEPRMKVEGQTYFPGLAGPIVQAGSGATKVLRGVAVIEIGVIPGLLGSLIDMSGPGAELTELAATHNLCVIVQPRPELSVAEAARMVKSASTAAALHVASATLESAPDSTAVYDLSLRGGAGATGAANRADSTGAAGTIPAGPCDRSLPRVAYLLHLNSVGPLREPLIYGDSTAHYYPTVLHPNEVLDGAVACGHYNLSSGFKNLTYAHQNNPVIRGLYARHGIDLEFCGVVLANEPVSLADMRRTAMMACGLLHEVLGAEGVIMTKEGGGHTDVVLMESCEACERAGLRTVVIDNEWLGVDGSGDSPLLAASPAADAMVSVGNIEAMVELPGVAEVVGGDAMSEMPGDLQGPLRVPIWLITGALSHLGSARFTTERR